MSIHQFPLLAPSLPKLFGELSEQEQEQIRGNADFRAY